MQDKYSRENDRKNFVQNENWASSIITNMWHSLHHIWTERCNEVPKSQTTAEETCLKEQYILKTKDFYNTKYLIEQADQALFMQPIKNITTLPFPLLKNWVRRNEKFIRNSIKRAA